MTKEPKSMLINVDTTLVFLYLVMVFLGWINIYAAVYNDEHQSILDISQNYGKQLIWIASSALIAITILFTHSRFFSTFSYIIYGTIILLLLAVLLTGTTVSGSKSWFQIGSFRLQPSEFAKFATNLALARFLSTQQLSFKKLKNKLIPLLIVGVPGALILLQNDTGSALVFGSFILVLYRFGMSGRFLVAGLLAVAVSLSTLIFDQYPTMIGLVVIALLMLLNMKRNKRNLITMAVLTVIGLAMTFAVNYAFDEVLSPHQRTRINVLLGKELDLQGAGYNVNQSKIAIGSGGIFGKGFLNGTQTKYNFVPEQSTDFIFCTVGEEWGLLGTLTVVGLYMWLLYRIVVVAERQRSLFSKIYGYGVAAILFFHFTINIGMTIGLVPVIGIPLPFFSYGGSSLWSFTILLFIFIKLDSKRSAFF